MDTDQPRKRTPRCSICASPAVEAFAPFCSARCGNVDLARWLGGGYAIAGGTVEADEDGDESQLATRDEPE